MARTNVMSTKVILAALAAAVLIAASSIATYAFIVNDQSAEFSVFSSSDNSKRAYFMNLEKLVITIDGEERTHYLMLELALKTSSAKAHDQLIEYKPLVRNALLKLFSKNTFEELRQMDEIERMQTEALGKLRQAMALNGYAYQIDEVLFTKLVLQ